MSNINALTAGHRRFKAGYFVEKRALFEQLSAQGQAPKTAVICCCDSRVDPSIIFDTGPGELFVIRNVANIVPPYEPDSRYHGTSAGLEFAVSSLNVSDIIVLGHAQCSGIHALLESNPENSHKTEFIGNWMSIMAPVRDQVLAYCADKPFETQRLELEQRSIAASVENLKSFPEISGRLTDGSLRVHGWHFDIGTGMLVAYDDQSKVFELLPD